VYIYFTSIYIVFKWQSIYSGEPRDHGGDGTSTRLLMPVCAHTMEDPEWSLRPPRPRPPSRPPRCVIRSWDRRPGIRGNGPGGMTRRSGSIAFCGLYPNLGSGGAGAYPRPCAAGRSSGPGCCRRVISSCPLRLRDRGNPCPDPRCRFASSPPPGACAPPRHPP
jgi:hypothetical protein